MLQRNLPRTPTRGSSCLDIIATSLQTWEYGVATLDPVIADHCPVTINVCLQPVNLMVGNAGLVYGIQYEHLAKLFTQYGSVEKIVMIPRKSYSFVVYYTIDDAAKAYSSINGQVKLSNMDGPIYLVYTASVPAEFSPPVSDFLPEGLTVLKDFVSCEEEEQLLNCVNWDTLHQEAVVGKTLKHRRVKHFGYEFRYDDNTVDKDSPLNDPIPKECSFIERRLEDLGHPLKWSFNQLTVNRYQKGQGIPSHIDTHSAFETPLVSLSLTTDTVMEFRRGSQHIPVLLPRRSLLIMDGEARYAWAHGITPRTMDVVSVVGGLSVRERGCRTSFTLRRVREVPCNCQYPDYCDSQQVSAQPLILDHQANKLEELYVHKVYNNIACHFSETRTKIWPNVQEFLLSFTCGSILVDAGCGNGKYFGTNPEICQIGFDRSLGLAEITHSRGHEVFVSDCLLMTLRDEVADGVISVAVLHHLSTKERRLQALREISRVLVTGGRALVTVWAKDQTKQEMTSYLKQGIKNRKKSKQDFPESVVPRYENFNNDICRMHEFKEQDLTDKSNTQTLNPSSRFYDTKESINIQCSDFNLPVHVSRTQFQHQDVFVPWKVKSKEPNNDVKEVFLRYYHVFEENELSQLCSTLTDIKIVETYYTQGNWCITFEKVKS